MAALGRGGRREGGGFLDYEAAGLDRFRPSPWLRRVAAAGRGLEDWRDPERAQGAFS